jgi:hypothetical protein
VKARPPGPQCAIRAHQCARQCVSGGRVACHIGQHGKKELARDFKKDGRELRPREHPEPVRVHDFAIPELGKVSSYGVYDIAANTGWINLGMTSDTGICRRKYPPLVVRTRTGTLQEGPSDPDHGRLRQQQWCPCAPSEKRTSKLADQTRLSITVAHLPSGTSKWNRIKHRLFAFITQNWRGKPLVTHEVIIQLIANTTTKTGLTVQCRLRCQSF